MLKVLVLCVLNSSIRIPCAKQGLRSKLSGVFLDNSSDIYQARNVSFTYCLCMHDVCKMDASEQIHFGPLCPCWRYDHNRSWPHFQLREAQKDNEEMKDLMTMHVYPCDTGEDAQGSLSLNQLQQISGCPRTRFHSPGDLSLREAHRLCTWAERRLRTWQLFLKKDDARNIGGRRFRRDLERSSPSSSMTRAKGTLAEIESTSSPLDLLSYLSTTVEQSSSYIETSPSFSPSRDYQHLTGYASLLSSFAHAALLPQTQQPTPFINYSLTYTVDDSWQLSDTLQKILSTEESHQKSTTPRSNRPSSETYVISDSENPWNKLYKDSQMSSDISLTTSNASFMDDRASIEAIAFKESLDYRYQSFFQVVSPTSRMTSEEFHLSSVNTVPLHQLHESGYGDWSYSVYSAVTSKALDPSLTNALEGPSSIQPTPVLEDSKLPVESSDSVALSDSDSFNSVDSDSKCLDDAQTCDSRTFASPSPQENSFTHWRTTEFNTLDSQTGTDDTLRGTIGILKSTVKSMDEIYKPLTTLHGSMQPDSSREYQLSTSPGLESLLEISTASYLRESQGVAKQWYSLDNLQQSSFFGLSSSQDPVSVSSADNVLRTVMETTVNLSDSEIVIDGLQTEALSPAATTHLAFVTGSIFDLEGYGLYTALESVGPTFPHASSGALTSTMLVEGPLIHSQSAAVSISYYYSEGLESSLNIDYYHYSLSSIPPLLSQPGSLLSGSDDGKVEFKETVLLTEGTFASQPITEQGFTSQPITDPGLISQPVTDPELASLPITEPGLTSQPITDPELASQPVTEPGLTSQPVTDPELASQPITEPGLISQPVTDPELASQPITEQGLTSQPVTDPELASQPITEQGLTSQPVTDPELASQPITEPGLISQPVTDPELASQSITEPGLISQSVTEPGLTSQPITEQGLTSQPVTDPELASQPITEPGLTSQPITEPGLTSQPSTELGLTSQPITDPELASQPVTDPELASQLITKPGLTSQPITDPELASQPITEQGLTSQPVTDPELASQPITEPGLISQPVTDPELASQSITEPGLISQSVTEPGLTSQPITEQGLTSQPVTDPELASQPITEPGLTSQPITEPGLTSQPSTELGLTSQPITDPELASQPVTDPELASQLITKPGLTSQPITEPGLMSQPVTEQRRTSQPITEPGCTSLPVTNQRLTSQPITDPGLISQPVTDPELASQPITEPGLTSQPVTKPELASQPDTEQGLTSQPVTEPKLASQPITEPGLTSQPVTKQGLTSQPITEPGLTSQPVTKQGLTSQPITKQGLTSQPVTKQGLTSRPVTTPGLTSQPVTKQGLTSEPVTKQGLTSQPVTTPGLTSQPITKQGLTSQPVTTPGLTSQPITKQGLTSQPVTDHHRSPQPSSTLPVASPSPVSTSGVLTVSPAPTSQAVTMPGPVQSNGTSVPPSSIQQEHLLEITMQVNSTVDIFEESFRTALADGLLLTFLQASEQNQTRVRRADPLVTVEIYSISRLSVDSVLVQFVVLEDGNPMKSADVLETLNRLPDLLGTLNDNLPFPAAGVPSAVAVSPVAEFAGWLAGVVVLAAVCLVLAVLLGVFVKKSQRSRREAQRVPERALTPFQKGHQHASRGPVGELGPRDAEMGGDQESESDTASSTTGSTPPSPAGPSAADPRPRRAPPPAKRPVPLKRPKRKRRMVKNGIRHHQVTPVESSSEESSGERDMVEAPPGRHIPQNANGRLAGQTRERPLPIPAPRTGPHFKSAVTPFPPLQPQRLTGHRASEEGEDEEEEEERRPAGSDPSGRAPHRKEKAQPSIRWAPGVVVDRDQQRKTEAEHLRNKKRLREKQRQAQRDSSPGHRRGYAGRGSREERGSRRRSKAARSQAESDLAAWRRVQAQISSLLEPEPGEFSEQFRAMQGAFAFPRSPAYFPGYSHPMPLEYGAFGPQLGRGQAFPLPAQLQPAPSQLANSFGPWAQPWQKAPIPNTRHNAEFLRGLQGPHHHHPAHAPPPPPHPSFYPQPSGLADVLQDGGWSSSAGQSRSRSSEAPTTPPPPPPANPPLSAGSGGYLRQLAALTAPPGAPRAEGKRKAKRGVAGDDGGRPRPRPPDRPAQEEAGAESFW